MIELVNKLIELLVTGLFTSLWFILFSKMGILPIIALQFLDEKDVDKDNGDDLPY